MSRAVKVVLIYSHSPFTRQFSTIFDMWIFAMLLCYAWHRGPCRSLQCRRCQTWLRYEQRWAVWDSFPVPISGIAMYCQSSARWLLKKRAVQICTIKVCSNVFKCLSAKVPTICCWSRLPCRHTLCTHNDFQIFSGSLWSVPELQRHQCVLGRSPPNQYSLICSRDLWPEEDDMCHVSVPIGSHRQRSRNTSCVNLSCFSGSAFYCVDTYIQNKHMERWGKTYEGTQTRVPVHKCMCPALYSCRDMYIYIYKPVDGIKCIDCRDWI